MFNIGWTELLLIAIVFLIFIKPKDYPFFVKKLATFFYKVKNSWVEFHFFSKDNKLLKKEKFTNLNYSNEVEITSKYLNGLEDELTFCSISCSFSP